MRTHLGYILKCHRIAAGLSRKQVAVRTGYSTFTIAAMEQGRAASVSAYAGVLKCYGMTLGDLLVQDDQQRETAINACRIRDVVSDYPQAMALGDMSGAELV